MKAGRKDGHHTDWRLHPHPYTEYGGREAPNNIFQTENMFAVSVTKSCMLHVHAIKTPLATYSVATVTNCIRRAQRNKAMRIITSTKTLMIDQIYDLTLFVLHAANPCSEMAEKDALCPPRQPAWELGKETKWIYLTPNNAEFSLIPYYLQGGIHEA